MIKRMAVKKVIIMRDLKMTEINATDFAIKLAK